MNNIFPASLISIALLMLALHTAESRAHQAGPANAGYVGDAKGHLITDGSGKSCVQTGTFDKDKHGLADCGTKAGVKVSDNVKVDSDTDGDGVVDRLDRCPGTAKGVKVDADGCPKLGEKVSVRLEVNFDVGKAIVKPEFNPEIKKVVDVMKRFPSAAVVIEGHTDSTGNAAFNKDLSQRRAEAVAQSLVRDHGIAAERVSAVGYGANRPIADNSTAAGRAKNRRTTAVIEAIEAP